MESFDRFIGVVRKYAEAYRDLEELQKCKSPEFDFIPEVGDQKTGVIGEAFIFEYLKREGHPDVQFASNPAQKGWDIKYHCGLAPNNVVYVQVKTVSAFSKTKKISPIHLAPDYGEQYKLYLVSLDENLIPDGIWKPRGYSDTKIKLDKKGEKVVVGTRMPKNPQDYGSGFKEIENVFDDFKRLFPELYPAS